MIGIPLIYAGADLRSGKCFGLLAEGSLVRVTAGSLFLVALSKSHIYSS